MHQQPLTFTHPACQQLLLSQLRTALRELALSSASSDLLNRSSKHIQLQKTAGSCKVLYTSGVAFQLEKAQKIPALDLATAIASHLSALAELLRARAEDDFTVQVVPPGWIYFHISESALAARLQSLAQAPPWGGDGKIGRGETRHQLTLSSRLFAVQYAHARCCSLVRLAHRQGLISLCNPDPQASPPFCVNTPNPIPWLEADQKLCLIHPAECNLVRSLLQLLDTIYSPYSPTSPSHSPQWEKAALDLGQAFQLFHRRCQIWGEVRIENKQLAQARIGLVMATQSVLWLLLQYSGIEPLLEL